MGLTVFKEKWVLQQRRLQGLVNAKSGGNVVVVRGDLLQVELKDVHLNQFTQRQALQGRSEGRIQSSTDRNFKADSAPLVAQAFRPFCGLPRRCTGC